jgi:hypothetical protein
VHDHVGERRDNDILRHTDTFRPGRVPGGGRAATDTGSVTAPTGPASSIALGAHVMFETCFDGNAKVQYLVSRTSAKF